MDSTESFINILREHIDNTEKWTTERVANYIYDLCDQKLFRSLQIKVIKDVTCTSPWIDVREKMESILILKSGLVIFLKKKWQFIICYFFSANIWQKGQVIQRVVGPIIYEGVWTGSNQDLRCVVNEDLPTHKEFISREDIDALIHIEHRDKLYLLHKKNVTIPSKHRLLPWKHAFTLIIHPMP